MLNCGASQGFLETGLSVAPGCGSKKFSGQEFLVLTCSEGLARIKGLRKDQAQAVHRKDDLL